MLVLQASVICGHETQHTLSRIQNAGVADVLESILSFGGFKQHCFVETLRKPVLLLDARRRCAQTHRAQQAATGGGAAGRRGAGEARLRGV